VADPEQEVVVAVWCLPGVVRCKERAGPSAPLRGQGAFSLSVLVDRSGARVLIVPSALSIVALVALTLLRSNRQNSG
jgi:hypothetical protein